MVEPAGFPAEHVRMTPFKKEKTMNGEFARALFALVILATGTPGISAAQERYPNRTVQLVVPWPPGGPTDVYARLIASHLQGAWGQPVIVENRPGASGTTGAAFVARSAPDGYTLLFNSVTNLIAPLLQKSPAYDPVASFEPVAMVVRNPTVFLVSNPVPSKTLREFIAYAKQRPGQLNYSSPGVGTVGHLMVELLKDRAQIDLVHIPYKGGAPSLNAVVAGEVHFSSSDPGSARPQIEAGKVRALAQVGSERSPLLPQIPTTTEMGLPDFGVSFWNGLFAPKGTPAAIVAKLNQEINRAMAVPAIAGKALAFGSEIVTSTPEAFRARILQDAATYGTLIRQKRISAD